MNPALLALLGARAAALAAGGPPVAGYTAWYDFSDAGTLTMSGSEITAAADKSGNGHHLSRGTTGPAKVDNWPGTTLSFARFNGTDDKRLQAASDVGISGDFTLFAVAYATTASWTGDNPDVLFSVRSLSSYKPNRNTWMHLWSGTAGVTITTAAADITGQKVHVRSLSGTSHNYWLNTTQKVTNSNGGPGTAQQLLIGSEPGNGSDWNVGEVVAYASNLSAADRASVTSYLMTKWSIA